ncbi:hypothetical protein [Microcoleus sp. D2_18a_D3]|uniref:hypothetical protein n=1 Tax=Microcoleus sp. D2_18a_D3 TaxID=3055330 RepID=UPI002FD6E04D
MPLFIEPVGCCHTARSAPNNCNSHSSLLEGRRKKEEGRRKKEEGRRKKEEGSSATDCVTDVTDVTDVSPMEVGRRKKEEILVSRFYL